MNKSLWPDEILTAPHDVRDKAARVRSMFNAIAPRYELVNTVFSGRRDAAWRRRAVELADVRSDDVVLDVACGTGDLSRALARLRPAMVVGCDFAWEMLVRAKARGQGTERKPRSHGATKPRRENRQSTFDNPSGTCSATPRQSTIHWCGADALRLPFRNELFSLVGCAFGIRNLVDLAAGLGEMHRVLRWGGRVVILEFSRPHGRFPAWLHRVYCQKIMPRAASWLSGDHTRAYHYLPRSVETFPEGEELCGRLRDAGFTSCECYRLTFGIASVYVGRKEAR